MPRRAKDETVSDSVDASTAVAQTAETPAAAGADQAAEPKPKKELPLGPTTTRSGAQALVIPSPKGQRVFTAGGDKGGKIAELLKTKPEMSRKDIAALVGCSQSRVAEVARVLGLAAGRPPAAEQTESQTAPEAVNA